MYRLLLVAAILGLILGIKPPETGRNLLYPVDVPDVLQLRVTLLHVRPAVWRRVLVPADLTLNDLHSVLQHAMGWEHVHLHRFEMFSEIDATSPLRNFLRAERDWVTYVYDFGDEWEHEVRVEKMRSGRVTVPQLPWVLAGARACPPEDCGGPWVYMDMLRRKGNRQRSFLPRGFNPSKFDRAEINEDMPPLWTPAPKQHSATRAVKDIKPHYRSLRANPQMLGVTLLAEGEESRTVRVRGSAELHTWLKTLGAARLGEILEAARQGEQKTARDALSKKKR